MEIKLFKRMTRVILVFDPDTQCHFLLFPKKNVPGKFSVCVRTCMHARARVCVCVYLSVCLRRLTVCLLFCHPALPSERVRMSGLAGWQIRVNSPDLLQVDGVVIPRRTETRYLGVVLSVDLRWNSHIDYLLSVTAGPVHLCQKLAYQHRLPSLAIRRFYIAFVHPRLEYCCAAWCGLTHIQAFRLEKVRVRVARAVVRCPGGSRSQVVQEAALPTLSWRQREHCLALLWKLVDGIGPPALLNILPAAAASRSSSVLRSSYSLQFHLCLSSRRKSSCAALFPFE